MLQEEKLIRFDYAMKYMLRNKANFDVLEGFLSALLKEDIEVIEILESESNKEEIILKTNRVDILVRDSKNKRIIIEIQNMREIDYLERLLWGTSKVVVENIEVGRPFREVVKVISVSIMYFNLGKGDDYVYHGKTEFKGTHTGNPLVVKEKVEIKESGLIKYPEKQNVFPEYYLINVEKFNDIVTEDLDEWIYMFKNSNIKEDFKSKNIKKAEEKLKILKMDKQERNSYEKYLLSLVSETDVINTAKEEAKAEGREEEKINIVLNMLSEGIDEETISKLTKIDIEKVSEIKLLN